MRDVSGLSTVVQLLDDTSEARWDQFVDSCPRATFFHRAGWKRVIERSFGHRCHFLYVETEGNLRGVLPLVHVKSRLFANALISSAFCVYGGPVAVDDAACLALERAALALAESLQVDYLEFRLLGDLDNAHSDWASNNDLYVTFRKALAADPEQNLCAIPRKQRAMVRKGMKLGLFSELERSVERFYPIYAESVRNLGTPVFAKRYFENLLVEFGKSC